MKKGKPRFNEWCKRVGVKRFLFDLDDTICPTRQVFVGVMSQAYDFLATKATINSREGWKEEVETTNIRLFERLGVNANRWNHVVDELAAKYSLSGKIARDTKNIFAKIYTTPFVFLKHAEEGLDFIIRAGIPMGIVTHANTNWTLKKYEWLGLERFLKWDEVFIVDENGHKTANSWAQAIRYFGLEANQCAVVGDSPRSDINPAWSLGVRHCFLIEDPLLWSVHSQPVDPKVKRISHLAQISEIVLK